MDESGSRNGRVLPPGFVAAAYDIIAEGNGEVLWRIAEGLRRAGVEI